MFVVNEDHCVEDDFHEGSLSGRKKQVDDLTQQRHEVVPRARVVLNLGDA